MEIVPSIHLVEGTRGSSCYLITDSCLAVVDPGLPGNLRPLVSYIRKLGRKPKELRYILLTHSHPDHAGCVPAVRAHTGAQVLVHRGDAKADFRGRTSAFYAGVLGRLPVPVPFLERVAVDQCVEDGDVLPLLGGLRVIHTPGHTPGSINLHARAIGALFTGDIVVGDERGVGRPFPIPGSNWDHYQQSLERLATLDFQVALLGHGMPITQGASQVIRALAERQTAPPLGWRLVAPLSSKRYENVLSVAKGQTMRPRGSTSRAKTGTGAQG